MNNLLHGHLSYCAVIPRAPFCAGDLFFETPTKQQIPRANAWREE